MTAKTTGPELMTTAEVAALFRVDPKTVNRWAQQGRFPQGTVTRTPGGDRRFHRDGIEALLNGDGGRP